MDWKQTLIKGATQFDRLVQQIKPRFTPDPNIPGPLNVVTYRGYGAPDCLHLEGRVLRDQGIKLREENAPFWKNLWNMYRRFNSNEIPGARLRFSIDNVQQEVRVNEEGFYNVDLDLDKPLDPTRLWHTVNVDLLEPQYEESQIKFDAKAIVICQDSDQVDDAYLTRFGVISDIDDTIMHTAATDLLKMVRIAYFGNEYTRRPFPDVPALYRALQAGRSGRAGNPIFYVSSSAANLYDLFEKFMDINDVPLGPILLRQVEFTVENLTSFDHRLHKREKIEPILQRFPNLPFLLIGDSGQKDIIIYQKLLKDFPGQIAAIYIRDVTPNDPVRQGQLAKAAEEIRRQGCEFLLFKKTTEVAIHAAQRGWMQSLPGLELRTAEQALHS